MLTHVCVRSEYGQASALPTQAHDACLLSVYSRSMSRIAATVDAQYQEGNDGDVRYYGGGDLDMQEGLGKDKGGAAA